jgi:hypothetical protein
MGVFEFGLFMVLVIIVIGFIDKRSKEGIDKKIEEPPKLGISEPVLSIVKIFKENPKRFVIVDREDLIYTIEYFIADTVTKETFIVCYNKYSFGDEEEYSLRVSPMVLTKDEEEYLIEELLLPYLKRKEKYNRILEERKNLQERRRLTKIYKEK